MITPGENTLGKTGKKSTVLNRERTGRPNPHGNLKSFHSSLFLVEGSSDGLAAGDRFLSPGRMCLIHSVQDELSRFCAE